ERSRAAQRTESVSVGGGLTLSGKVSSRIIRPPTAFVGYERLRYETTVVAVILNGAVLTERRDRASGLSRADLKVGPYEAQAEGAEAGHEVEVVLHETPFYPESGGQVGDVGAIVGASGRMEVRDTQRVAERAIVHRGRVAEGRIAVNDTVVAQVDEEHRYNTMRNHTATHLLHAALRQVLGSHVRQSGSLVAPDRLRFDFSHIEAPKTEELAQVQHLVNEKIRANLPVRVRHTNFRQALDEGILAFFDEKYGDQVRVVEVEEAPSTGSGRFSGELCGGTHCTATGQIGTFIITGEGGIGAGLRRIEAVTGRGADAYVACRLETLDRIAQRLSTDPERAEARLQALMGELEEERRRVEALERQRSRASIEDYLARVENVNGVRVLATTTDATSMKFLRELGDMLKSRLAERAVIVLCALIESKPRFVAMVTPDLAGQGVDAGAIISRVAALTGGSGGGRPDMAQGGGKDVSKLADALRQVPSLVEKALPKESAQG
ncbi:MAG: DHHA1 domain-containing protein, partial [Dehalococcoidia bacterium]